MAKAKAAIKKTRRPAARTERLGPGLHVVRVELRAGDDFRVRTTAGTRVRAVLGDDMDPALAEECLRDGRPVIATDSERGPVLLGALQTRPAFERDASGQLAVRVKDLRLSAERGLVIEAGPFALRMDRSGAVRLEGNRMIIDMSEIVRVLSARVELP